MIQRVEFGDIAFMSGNKFNLQYFEPNEIYADYKVESYIDQDGQDFLSALYEPRYITLQGQILAKNKAEHYALRQQLISVCDGKTERDLTYFTGSRYYLTKAIAYAPVFDVRRGYCLPFSIKFVSPSFYWLDKRKTEKDIISYTPLLRTFNFNPSAMFSQTTAQADIYNYNIPTPFKIIITGRGGTSHSEYGIIVTNETTGEFIKIEKDVGNGEVITIDTDSATITSSTEGNIMTYVSDDSSPDMMLASGNNLIKAENLNVNNTITAVVAYRNRYVGV